MRRLAVALGLIAVLGTVPVPLAAGQRRAPPPPPPKPSTLAWPPGPGPARVRFVRTIDPSAMRGRPSALSRLVRAIVGPGDVATMTQPYGVAVGPDGRLYVADSTASTIHVYGLAKASYDTIHVEAESLIGITFTGRRLVVTDSVGARVICLEPDGRVVWSLGRKDGFLRPTGITAASGQLFVVDTLGNRVVTVSTAGDVQGSFGTRGVEPGQLNYPASIASDRDGHLYVVDTMNFRVQVFSLEGRALGMFGQAGDGPGDFDKPKGIAVDAQGLVYVVDGMNDVVKIFNPKGQLLLVFAGSGVGPGQLWLPAGITLTGSTVYVADTANRRVQVFERLGAAE